MTVFQFFYPILRPYWWRYLLMFQAPVVGCIYALSSNYAIKLIVDAFTDTQVTTYTQVITPIAIYLGSLLALETSWRISQYNWMQSQPQIRAKILSKAYNYVQGHSYEYFQNTQSGSVISKIKGIVDYYNAIWHSVHHKVTQYFLNCLACIIGFAMININIFWFMLCWIAVFGATLFFTLKKINYCSKQTSNSKHLAIALIADKIINIFTIFAFSKKNKELKTLENHLFDDMAYKDKYQIKWEFAQNIVGTTLSITMLFALFMFMIDLRIKNTIKTSDFVFVMTLSWFFIEQIWSFFVNMAEFVRNVGEFQASFSIIKTEHKIFDKKDCIALKIH